MARDKICIWCGSPDWSGHVEYCKARLQAGRSLSLASTSAAAAAQSAPTRSGDREKASIGDAIVAAGKHFLHAVGSAIGGSSSSKQKGRAEGAMADVPLAPRCYDFANSRLTFRTFTITYRDEDDRREPVAVSVRGTFGHEATWSQDIELAAVPSEQGVLWQLRIDLPPRRVEFRFRVTYERGREPEWRTSAAHPCEGQHRNNFLSAGYSSKQRRPIPTSIGKANDAVDATWSIVACMFAASRLHGGERASSLHELAGALSAAIREAERAGQDRRVESAVNALLAAEAEPAEFLRAVPPLASLTAGESAVDILERSLCPLGLDNLAAALGGAAAGPLRTLLVGFALHHVLVVWGGPVPAGRLVLLDPVPRGDEIGPSGEREESRRAAALEFDGTQAVRAYLSRELFGGRAEQQDAQDDRNSLARFCELRPKAPASTPSGSPAVGGALLDGGGDAMEVVRHRLDAEQRIAQERRRQEEDERRMALERDEAARQLAAREAQRRAEQEEAARQQAAREAQRRADAEAAEREEAQRLAEEARRRAEEEAELEALRELQQQQERLEAEVAQLRREYEERKAHNDQQQGELESARLALRTQKTCSTELHSQKRGAVYATQQILDRLHDRLQGALALDLG
eukprot:tig00000123_g6923.t1